jgi:hypothetical protein
MIAPRLFRVPRDWALAARIQPESEAGSTGCNAAHPQKLHHRLSSGEHGGIGRRLRSYLCGFFGHV